MLLELTDAASVCVCSTGELCRILQLSLCLDMCGLITGVRLQLSDFLFIAAAGVVVANVFTIIFFKRRLY